MAVSIHGNNGFITTNGTAAAPSLAAPDTDTGLYFGTNLIHASTSGTERLRIDSSGNLRFGQTTQITSNTADGSDNQAIYIGGGGSSSQTRGAQVLLHGNEYAGGYNGTLELLAGNSGNTQGTIDLFTGGNKRLTITSTGEVNIGGNYTQTNAPLQVTTGANDYGYRLTTGSNVVMELLNNDNAGNCEMRGYYNNNTGTRGEGFRLEANGETFFNPGGNTGLNVKSDGKVGINQTSPQRRLHIGTSGTAEANIRIQGGADYGEIRVKDSDNNLSFHHNVGGAGSRELFNSNGSTGHFSINCYTYQALTITTNENGANGPEIQLMHNSASPAANDVVGQIRYSGKDSAGNTTLYSKIQTVVDDPTNGQETGHIDFSTRGLAAYNSIFRLKARGSASAPSYTTDDMNGIILDTYNTGNPYPRYFNFIAKSAGNTDSNIGFWTESVGGSPTEKIRILSNGRVHIRPSNTFYAMNSLSTDLVIGDGGSGRGLTIWTAAGADNQTVSFQTNESLSRAEGEISYGPSHTTVTNNRHAMMFRTNSNERLRISSSGKVGIQVTDPKSLLHVYGPGDIRMGSGDTGVANIALQVEHADNYTGTHFMFEITDSAAWSFNGTHIAHGGGGSSYGLNITYIRAIAGRESGAANSGDTWRNGGHQYNSEVMTTGQIGLNPGAGSVSFVADDTPDGAGSTRSLYKISFSAAGQGTVTTWGKLQGVLTWASTSSNGIVKIKDKDGNVLWNSRP